MRRVPPCISAFVSGLLCPQTITTRMPVLSRKQTLAISVNQSPLLGNSELALNGHNGRKAEVGTSHSISAEALTLSALASFSTMVMVGFLRPRSISLT